MTAHKRIGWTGKQRILIRSIIGNNFNEVWRMEREKAAFLTKGQKMGKFSLLREFWDFMRDRKLYWLAPIIIILLLLGLLIVLTESSAVAPFIYTLF